MLKEFYGFEKRERANCSLNGFVRKFLDTSVLRSENLDTKL